MPAVVAAGGHAPPKTIDATQPWVAVQPVAVPAGVGLALIAKPKKIRSVAPFLISITGEQASPIKLKVVVRFTSGAGIPVVCNTPALLKASRYSAGRLLKPGSLPQVYRWPVPGPTE